MERGRLRIYVGYAPGVGKTFAMLDEARRRRARGTDVVLGFVETYGRQEVGAQTRGVEVVPHRSDDDGSAIEEMDVDAVLARHPEVAVVDELAHTNAAGSRNGHRWEDVEELLAAGIDVLSTVNIHHLESLHDVIEAITGEAPVDTVPDALVRDADQLELVDMTPQALQRRLAHGNVFPPERMDAALARTFREENLARLRELSLVWMADRVDEELRAGPSPARGSEPATARERILVAVRGGPEDEPVVRRAARMAARRGGELMAVHVIPDAGRDDAPHLEAIRDLVRQVGGRFEEVVGARVPDAILDLARVEGIMQVVLGAGRRSRFRGLLGGSVVLDVIRGSGPIDVHVISHEPASQRARVSGRVATGLSSDRQLIAGIAGAVVLVGLTIAVAALDRQMALSTIMLLYLTVVIGTAFGGGLRPAIPAAVVSALLINWFFTPPVHTWKVANPEDVVALVVFVVVAASVSILVDREARHRAEAQRRGAEAEALARLTARVAAEGDPLPELVEHARTTFGLHAVSVLRLREDGDQSRWIREAAAGADAPTIPEEAAQVVQLGHDTVLALRGSPLPADRLQLLSAFASQLGLAVRGRALAQEAAASAARAEADALRTAILAAVSHDLRTPLASIKASVSSLRDDEVVWSPEETALFLGTIEDETDRLTGLVANLLDMSRLQVGALKLVRDVVGFDEVVPKALASLPDGGRELVVDVPETLPRMDVDPGLLERAIANIVANASALTAPDCPVRIHGSTAAGRVELRVIDRGPGVQRQDRERMFRPFQRLGDGTSRDGIGLGLAVAKGFVEAMDGELSVEDTPGGGLTMVLAFRAAST
ncbi:MAG: sensor histidine kinase KdpD [Actinobacteria bacterium]|nr:MAG: sensor histidine kinase KdpD [Actinomycetota bacterium]